MHDEDHIRAEALAWAVRTGDPAFADWETFTLWLEADPAHALAYDRVSVAVADAANALAAAPVANDDRPVPKRWWTGGAVAAALAGVLMVSLWNGPQGSTIVATAPGETELIALDDGSTITLAGGTRIELTDGNDREARLLEGQALFTVVHDDSDPFVLLAGEDRLVDVGTIFDVKLGRAGIVLGVSEGAVVFNPDGQNEQVDAGEFLLRRAGSDELELGLIDPAQVGEWTDGRLTFDMANLDVVAEDLTRATGLAFTAVEGRQGHTVSGSLLTAPVKDNPRVLEALLDVRVRRVGEGWEIAER